MEENGSKAGTNRRQKLHKVREKKQEKIWDELPVPKTVPPVLFLLPARDWARSVHAN